MRVQHAALRPAPISLQAIAAAIVDVIATNPCIPALSDENLAHLVSSLGQSLRRRGSGPRRGALAGRSRASLM